MNLLKLINKYLFPIIIIILLIAFIIWASTMKEGFKDCVCPSGSSLRNGGCYMCESGYTLNNDYYIPLCLSGSNTKPPIMKNVVCN